MLDIFSPVALSAWIMLALWVVLLAAKAFALVEVLRHNANLFPAAGKQTKQLWLIFTALGLVFHLLTDPISLLNIAGTIAAIVFLVDVRPALQQVSGRGGGSRQGPYGPW